VKLACTPEVGAGRVRVGILVAKGHRAEALAHTLHRVVRNSLAHLRIVGDVIACIFERSDELLCAAPIGVSRGRFSIGATRIETLSPLVIRGNFADARRTPGVGALRHLRRALAVLQAEPLAANPIDAHLHLTRAICGGKTLDAAALGKVAEKPLCFAR
jgi:hypothetical protein